MTWQHAMTSKILLDAWTWVCARQQKEMVNNGPFSLLPLLLQRNDCCSVMCTNFVYDSIEQRACKFFKRFGLFLCSTVLPFSTLEYIRELHAILNKKKYIHLLEFGTVSPVSLGNFMKIILALLLHIHTWDIVCVSPLH